jgi:hypothetical protein
MNLQARMKEIVSFLKPYQSIWQNEIMLLYPQSFDNFNPEWLDEINQIEDMELLLQLEKKLHQNVVKGKSLYDFYEEVENLTRFPASPQLPEMPENKYSWLYIIPKKKHEIKQLGPLISHFYHQNQIERMIDIGGGIGLLSQTVSNAYQIKITSVDMDGKLQETGRKRHEKNAQGLEKVEFKQIKVSKDEPSFLAELNSKRMTVGLHTCGPLAVSQIQASVAQKVKTVINLGCCYLKLNDDDDQNLSEFAKIDPLHMNPYALTLACGPHRKVSLDSVAFKRSVKYYRYSLHALLIDKYQRDDILVFGNSSDKVYDGSFAQYVRGQFEKVGLAVTQADEELQSFYEEKFPIVKKMYAAGFIRDALSRLLEVYLLLDRAIYLEENNYQVEILEVFDENISPRNLAIIAHLRG